MSAVDLGSRFAEVVRQHAEAPAISNESAAWTFAELGEAVARLAPLLTTEGPARKVLVAVPGGPECTTVTLANLAARAVTIPVPAESTRDEATRLLALVQPDLLVVESLAKGEALVASLRRPTLVWSLADDDASVPAGHALVCGRELGGMAALPWPESVQAGTDLPDGTAFLQFTSGSSGTPKGIVLSQGNLCAYLDHQQSFLSRFTGQQVFCPVPQAHSYGGTVTLEHLFHGVGVHLATRFLPAADVARMTAQGCQGLLAPPSYVRMLLQVGGFKDGALPALEWINLGTAPVDQDLVQRLRARRPDLTLFVRYGLSETMGYVSRLELSPGEILEHPGLVGEVLSGVEVADGLPEVTAAEPGVIRVRGPVVATGQLLAAGRVEPLTDAEGWFSTGDLACRDARGRLHLRGRTSSFLKRSGFRINPFEIEDLLMRQPGVGEAVVVGLPDPLMGERLVAVLEAGADGPPPEPGECLDRCREHLSAFKIPQECVLRDRIPRTPAGKPDRPALVEQLQTERKRGR